MTMIKFYDPRVGAFCGLSNLHPRPMIFEGVAYASAEHAYQAFKAREPAVRAWLMAAPSPELVAVAGDALPPDDVVPDWPETHVPLMERIVRAKFLEHGDLLRLLLSTGTAKIVEWAPEDSAVARFWGEYEGVGENTLGVMLMRLRDELREKAA
jgi:ribA/ribD-fused uncharacterized protein